MANPDHCRLYLQDDAMSAHPWNRNAPRTLEIGGIIASNTQLIIAVIKRYTYYTILLIYVHKLTAQSGEASAMKGQILEDLVVSTDLATNRLMIYGLSCWSNQAAQQLVTLHLGFSVPQQRDCVVKKNHTHTCTACTFALASVHVNANN